VSVEGVGERLKKEESSVQEVTVLTIRFVSIINKHLGMHCMQKQKQKCFLSCLS
jgi:hypothetical protein